MVDRIKFLKITLLLGAITDGVAVIPMTFPQIACIFWGFSNFTGIYHFAMGYGASLMAGWTLLLIWASKKPLERRFVAFLTIVVIVGLVTTEVYAVLSGYIDINQVVPTLLLQTVLLGLFGLPR